MKQILKYARLLAILPLALIALTPDLISGPGGHHLRIEQRMPCDQAQEEPVMPVGPVHHRGDAEGVPGFLRIRDHASTCFRAPVHPWHTRNGQLYTPVL